MKRWLIIVGVIVLFGFLTIRAFKLRVDRTKEEREWYRENLDYNFSATVDSVTTFPRGSGGMVYFHPTAGNPDFYSEGRLNAKLKYAKNLRFIFRKKNQVKLFYSFQIKNYQAGDSLVVNSSEDKISVYRSDSLTSENKISRSLR